MQNCLFSPPLIWPRPSRLKKAFKSKKGLGVVLYLRSPNFAHYWPPTYPWLTYWWRNSLENRNLYTVDISSTTYLPILVNVVKERPLTAELNEKFKSTPSLLITLEETCFMRKKIISDSAKFQWTADSLKVRKFQISNGNCSVFNLQKKSMP